MRKAARSKSRAASACRTASSARSCASYQRLARWCSSGTSVRLLGEQARPQHVGEQVVVAKPLPLVVQGDEEQVGPLQRREHVATVVTADDGVTERPGEPVEDRRAQQELAHRLGLVREHLLDEVVDEVPVGPGEPGDEAR